MKYVKFAIEASKKGTCKRRQIGAALFDKDEKLLSVGWNGPKDGVPSCFDVPCPGANVPAGTGGALGITGCIGIHAEIRALESTNTDLVRSAFVTKAPCPACVQELLKTPCERIVFLTDSNDQTNRALWVKAGRVWEHANADN